MNACEQERYEVVLAEYLDESEPAAPVAAPLAEALRELLTCADLPHDHITHVQARVAAGEALADYDRQSSRSSTDTAQAESSEECAQ